MKYLVSYFTLNVIFFANIVSSSVNITAIYDDPATLTKKYDFRHSLQMTCNVSSDLKSVTVKWEKEGKLVNDIESLKGRIRFEDKNGIYNFKVIDAGEEDGGNYSCVAYKDSKEIGRAYITAASNIYVKTPDNINVVEGEKLEIHCLVHGNPPPEISWIVDNETHNKTYDKPGEEDDHIQLQPDEKQIPNAKLVIKEVQMTDRGVYTCRGYSNITKQEVLDETMIRVKDKYAAVWPFLGICAEVFVLCAIILIYEKKRNKTELEESDTDQSPDQKNTPDHAGKDANLRHRQ